MIDTNEKRRSQIIQQALHARTEEEVSDALCQLDRWLKQNPDDQSIRDAYEPLMLRQMSSPHSAESLAAVK